MRLIIIAGLKSKIPEMRFAISLSSKFTFDVPLEDERLCWVQWKNWQFEEFVPPGVGETVGLENFE